MYSHSETERALPLSRRRRIKPFFKALLISTGIEFVVLLLTGGAMASSMMRHSSAAPRPALADVLASIGFIFHFFSSLIATAFGLFLFAPLIQIALMTGIFSLIFRAREKGQSLPLSIKS